MIHRAKFQNFKALRDVEVTFDSQLTVLVGPNGSGKTSVLQGIEFVGNFAKASRAPAQYSRHSSGGNLVFGWQELDTDFDPLALEAGTTFVLNGDYQNPITAYYSCSSLPTDGRLARGEGIEHNFYLTDQAGGIRGNLPQLRQLRSATLLRLDPRRIAAPSFTTRVPPTAASDGTGLPSVLAYLVRKYPETYRRIVEALNVVIPNVKNVRLDLAQTPQGYGDVLLFDFQSAQGVSAASTSDGTLVLLGLATTLLLPDGPRLVLLDDLDHRLHPKAQMELIGVLRKLLAQFPDLQIIATSHSPYILNKLEWNEVRVTGLRDDGSALCVRLEDHPEVERWRDAMTPGEFWSHAGDDWVKKLAKPAPVTPEPATAAP